MAHRHPGIHWAGDEHIIGGPELGTGQLSCRHPLAQGTYVSFVGHFVWSALLILTEYKIFLRKASYYFDLTMYWSINGDRPKTNHFHYVRDEW